jgi:hypothetical protein
MRGWFARSEVDGRVKGIFIPKELWYNKKYSFKPQAHRGYGEAVGGLRIVEEKRDG